MEKKDNKLILYKDEEGKLSVNTLFADEDVWLRYTRPLRRISRCTFQIFMRMTNSTKRELIRKTY